MATRQDAIDLLGARQLASGEYIYYADKAQAYYVIDENDLDHLAELMDGADPKLWHDAYSHWCASTSAAEATNSQLDEIGADKGYQCECGEATGVRCDAPRMTRAETVLVEWMPEALRASHAAAGNMGSWPANGALRLRVHADCAEMLTHEPTEDGGIGEPSEWAWIVGAE